MSSASGPLYIGIKGHVVAIDPATGSEIWRCRLKSSGYVTVHADAGRLYAGASGQLFCIERTTGSVLWQSGLPGLGYNFITFPGTTPAAAVAEEKKQK
jgi:outer membrane protein assembly factor BamB